MHMGLIGAFGAGWQAVICLAIKQSLLFHFCENFNQTTEDFIVINSILRLFPFVKRKELAELKTAIANSTETSEIWRHKRTKEMYRIVAVGHIEADHSPCVTYQAVNSGVVWVRPSIEFFDGRFEKVD